MSFDTSNVPLSPALLAAIVGYGVFSWVFAGPEMTTREIAQSNWQEECETLLRDDLEATRRPDRVVPQIPNIVDPFCSAYPELRHWCDMIPDPNAHANELERQARRAEEARIRNATSGIEDACSCAEVVYIEEEAMSLAIWAGTGRYYQPPVIEDRTAALTRALRSPACRLETGASQ